MAPGLKITKDGNIFQNEKIVEKVFTPYGVKVIIDNKEYFVARLVAEEFLEDYKPFHTIKFIDGNISNVSVDNLELYLPSQSVGSHRKSTREIVLINKRDENDIRKFKSLADASEFLGYDRNYLSRMFFRTGEEELGWWHDYDVYEIGENDTRTINRNGKYISLRNKLTDETFEFDSLNKASIFLGKHRKYITTRLRDYDSLPESCEYEILEIRG